MTDNVDSCMGIPAHTVDIPTIPWVLKVPDDWEVDSSGADQGVLIAMGPESDISRFGSRLNLSLLHTDLPEGMLHFDAEQALADQDKVESSYQEELSQYRLIDLRITTIGVNDEPAVYRFAMYVSDENIPVMMAQFITRADGKESTFTVTWSAQDSKWIINSKVLARCLERKATR